MYKNVSRKLWANFVFMSQILNKILSSQKVCVEKLYPWEVRD